MGTYEGKFFNRAMDIFRQLILSSEIIKRFSEWIRNIVLALEALHGTLHYCPTPPMSGGEVYNNS